MKVAAISFLLLLGYAHLTDPGAPPLGKPMSMHRDGHLSLLGHALFVLLLAITALHALALSRSDRIAEAVITTFGGMLLLVVALTPSIDAFHEFTSFVLLLVLYAYYGVLTWRAGALVFVLHLTAPAWIL